MDMSPLLDESLLAARKEQSRLRAEFREISRKVKAANIVASEKEKAAWSKILQTVDLDNIEDILLITKALAEGGTEANLCEDLLSKWVKAKSSMLNIDLVWNDENREELYFYLPQVQLELRKNATLDEKDELQTALLYFHELFAPFEKNYTFTFFEKSFGKNGDFTMKIDDPLNVKVFKGPHDIFKGSILDAINYCCARIYY